MNQANS